MTDPMELEKIRDREMDITKERIEKILAAGANLILTTKGIDDMSLKYFVEAGAIACRRVPKDDLRRIARASGAQVVTTMADMEGNESFDGSVLGLADEVWEERVSDDDMIVIKGCKSTRAATLLLRGANDYYLDEMDRSIHDAMCIVQKTLESGSVVPGGGAIEAALSIYLENFATTLGSREQLAIAEFADALLVIPKTLTVNAAKDATELVAKLRAYHHTSQVKEGKGHLAHFGLDLYNGGQASPLHHPSSLLTPRSLFFSCIYLQRPPTADVPLCLSSLLPLTYPTPPLPVPVNSPLSVLSPLV